MTPAPSSSLEAALAHRDFVRKLARSLLADRHAAEDVAQQTWQTALERPPASVRNLRGWLRGTVANLTRQHVRTESRRRRRETAAAPGPVESAAETAERMEELGHLLAALRALPEAHRVVVMLRFFDDLPPRRIAERLDIRVETVKSRLQRALDRLRRELDETARRQRGAEAGWRALVAPLAGLPTAPAKMSSGVLLAAGALVVIGGAATWRLMAGGGDETPPAAAGAPAAVADADAEFRASRGAEGDAAAARRVVAAGEAADANGVDDARRPGPTFRLHYLGLPADLRAGFSARLAAADRRQEHATAFGTVTGTPPVARFGPEAEELRGGPPFRLEVRSDDGFWLGSAAVESATGRYPHTVNIDVDHRGAVRGVLTEADGTPIGQARVTLLDRSTAAEDTSPTGHLAVTDDQGRYALLWVPPGPYDLVASSHLHAGFTSRVAVEAGSTHVVHGVLPPLPGSVLHGELSSRAGSFAGTVFVVLTEVDGDRVLTREVEVGPAGAGGRLGSFRFDALPHGTYEVTVHTDTFHRWAPASHTVSPPFPPVTFTVADDAPARDLTLRADDAFTGAPIAAFDVFARLDGTDNPATSKVLRSSGGAVTLEAVPNDADLEWILRASGHVPLRGDRRTFSTERVVVRPRPGWGNRFFVVDAHGAPVAGVPLRLDRMEVGSTGSRGVLDVALPQRPTVLQVAADDMRMAGGDVFADGTFEDLIWGVTVVLQPRDD